MSHDLVAVAEDEFRGDVIARSASVPMVTEEKVAAPVSKEIPIIDCINPLDIANSRIRRFSSGSMIMSVSSPKLSRLSPARLEQIKCEELDPFVMQEIAHERATCSNLAVCSNLAQLMMTKDWSVCDAETSSDASSSTESSSIAAASSLSSGIGIGIHSSGGVSPTVAKQFPSPLSVMSPSPPPYSFAASSVPNRVRATNRCHKRSQSPKTVPGFTFSSSANASPASSTASGGANSPTTLTPNHSGTFSSLLRPSSLRSSATKRRFDGPSLFYHHTTPSAAIGTGVAASSDPDSPLTFRKSRLLVQATTSSTTIAQSVQQQKDESGEECQPAKIKRPSSLVSDVYSSSMSENESACSTPASSTPQSQSSLLAGGSKDAQNQAAAVEPLLCSSSSEPIEAPSVTGGV